MKLKIEQRIRIDRAGGRAPIYIARRNDDPKVIGLYQASSRIFLTDAEFDQVADAVDALGDPKLGTLQRFEVNSD